MKIVFKMSRKFTKKEKATKNMWAKSAEEKKLSNNLLVYLNQQQLVCVCIYIYIYISQLLQIIEKESDIYIYIYIYIYI